MSTGVGDIVRVIRFDGRQVVPHGTRGTVYEIDDAGVLYVRWDTGDLGTLLPGFDQWMNEGSQAASFAPEVLLGRRRARLR